MATKKPTPKTASTKTGGKVKLPTPDHAQLSTVQSQVVVPVVENEKKEKSGKTKVTEKTQSSQDQSQVVVPVVEEAMTNEKKEKSGKTKVTEKTQSSPDQAQVVVHVIETVMPEKKEKSGKTKLTEKAQLTLNVNAVRTWLKRYYEQNGIDVPTFRGIHIALTTVCEVLCTEIVNATVKQLQKSQSGLYEITRPSIRYGILLDGDLEHLLGTALNAFDKTMNFSDHFCIPQKEMLKYIEFKIGKNINIDITAYNLLSYLLSKAMIDFARTALICMTYADKGSLDFKVIRFVVKLKCTGSLENNLIRHIEDTEKLFVHEKEEQPLSVENEHSTDNPTDTPTVLIKTPTHKLQPVEDDTLEEQLVSSSDDECAEEQYNNNTEDIEGQDDDNNDDEDSDEQEQKRQTKKVEKPVKKVITKRVITKNAKTK